MFERVEIPVHNQRFGLLPGNQQDPKESTCNYIDFLIDANWLLSMTARLAIEVN